MSDFDKCRKTLFAFDWSQNMVDDIFCYACSNHIIQLTSQSLSATGKMAIRPLLVMIWFAEIPIERIWPVYRTLYPNNEPWCLIDSCSMHSDACQAFWRNVNAICFLTRWSDNHCAFTKYFNRRL